MSAVRMCDRCGALFSERADGWTSMQATNVKRGPDGRQVAVPENMDACPDCSNGLNTPAPRLPEIAATPARTKADRE